MDGILGLVLLPFYRQQPRHARFSSEQRPAAYVHTLPRTGRMPATTPSSTVRILHVLLSFYDKHENQRRKEILFNFALENNKKLRLGKLFDKLHLIVERACLEFRLLRNDQMKHQLLPFL